MLTQPIINCQKRNIACYQMNFLDQGSQNLSKAHTTNPLKSHYMDNGSHCTIFANISSTHCENTWALHITDEV